MKNILILLLLTTFISCHYASSEKEWQQSSIPQMAYKVSKMDGNIRYTVDSTMPLEKREELIKKTKQYIAENLEIIEEKELKDSIHIITAKDLDEMEQKLVWERCAGKAFTFKEEGVPEYYIFFVFSPEYNVLKHELMHMVAALNWGQCKSGFWMREGIPVFAEPETYSSDGYTLEERYLYYLQTDQLFEEKDLMEYIHTGDLFQTKRIYNQSGYLVSVLYEKYGIEKLKQLWQSDMDDFEKIYGVTFAQMIEKINTDLNEKYPEKVDFDEERMRNRSIG